MRKSKELINEKRKKWLKVAFSILNAVPIFGSLLESFFSNLLEAVVDKEPCNVKLNNIYYNSKKYYELMVSQGRFKHLEISNDIMTDFNTNCENDEQNLVQNAEKSWMDNAKHLLLVGEGGMGKTVSLINIWSYYLNEKSKDKPIPIFIALNEFNYVNQSDSKLGFICSKIIETYIKNSSVTNLTSDEVFEILNSEHKVKKNEINNSRPTTILLLDGFNEITKADKTSLIFELKQIIEKYKNIQVIITSRFDIRNSRGWNTCFNKLDLQPLKDEKIGKYLKDKNIPLPEDITLRQLVRNPMMLSLYAISCDVLKNHKDNSLIRFKENIETSGELIWNYIEGQIAATIERSSDENILQFNIFLFREMLPYIGYEVEKRGRYDLSFSELQDVISNGYTEFSNARYKNILSKSYGFNYLNILKLKSGVDEFINSTIQILTYELMMLVNENTDLSNSYRFLHQNFRDFFAAVYIINDIKTGIVNNCFPKTMEERIIPVYIKRLIGDIEGEHYIKKQLDTNCYKYSKNESIFSVMLELYKDRFEKQSENAICNIIDIWKVSRGEISGVDLSYLNLKGYIFNNVICGRRTSNGYISVKFDNSKMDLVSFLPQGHYQWVYSAVYNEENKRFLSASRDGTVKEWNVETGECIYTYNKIGCEIFDVIYITQSIFLAVFNDNTLKKIDLTNSHVLNEFVGHNDRINSISVNKDKTKILTTSNDKTTKIWNTVTGECVTTIFNEKIVKCATFNSDETKVLLGCADGYIIEQVIKSKDITYSYRVHEMKVNSVLYDKYDSKILSGSDDSYIYEWDIANQSVINEYKGHSDKVNSVIYNSDETKILSASSDNTVREWSVANCTCIHTYDEHYDCVFKAVYSNGEENKILSASRDFSIREWSILTGEGIHTYEGLSYFSRTTIFSNDAKKILAASCDKTVKEWDSETGRCLNIYQGHKERVYSSVYSNDNKKILSTSLDCSIIEWNTNYEKPVKVYKIHDDCVDKAIYNNDMSRILSISADNIIKELDLINTETLKVFSDNVIKHNTNKNSMSLNKAVGVNSIIYLDDNKIISSHWDKIIRKWDVLTCKMEAEFIGHNDWIYSCILSKDKKLLYSSSKDGTIRVWNVNTGECTYVYKTEFNSIYTLKFNKDQTNILFAASDSNIYEWDTETKNIIKIYTGHTGRVFSAAYNSDYSKIVSFSEDQTIRVWDVDNSQCIKVIYNIMGLLIQGCTFRNIKDQNISQYMEDIIHTYGGII